MNEVRPAGAGSRDELSLALGEARASLGSAGDTQRVWEGLQARLGEAGATLTADAPAPAHPYVGSLLGGAKAWLSLCALAAVIGSGAWAFWPREAPVTPLALELSGEIEPARPLRGVAFRTRARAQTTAEDVEEKAPPAPRYEAQPARRARRPVARAIEEVRVDLAEEMKLIEAAQQVLEHSPRKALRFLSEHAERFDRGMLAEEREVMWIDALHRLGQTTQALAHAERFLASFPESAHRRAVEALASESAARDHNTGSDPVLTP